MNILSMTLIGAAIAAVVIGASIAGNMTPSPSQSAGKSNPVVMSGVIATK